MIEELKAKLRVREGKPGYGPNCEALRKKIAELEAQNAGN